jgi:predicted RNA polymerase sigma factor
MEPSEHLFRHEAGRMVATLTRIFGTHNLALAEDVVQDAFCRAFEVWKVRGVPENPSAWLMALFCPLNVSPRTRIDMRNAASSSEAPERSGSGDHFLVGFTFVVRTHLDSHFSIKPP